MIEQHVDELRESGKASEVKCVAWQGGGEIPIRWLVTLKFYLEASCQAGQKCTKTDVLCTQ